MTAPTSPVTEPLRDRTHTCGELRSADVGTPVVLMGWIHKIRDLGSLIFLDVRDRHGLTQVVTRADGEGDADVLALVKQLRPEFVVLGRDLQGAPRVVFVTRTKGADPRQ